MEMQNENPPQVYLTPEMQSILEELQRTLPNEVEVKPRPYHRDQTAQEQGQACYRKFQEAKIGNNRIEMILYMYYLGEVVNKTTDVKRNYNAHRVYLSTYYWKLAVKTFYLFRLTGCRQIYRTSKRFKISHIVQLTMNELDIIENLFGMDLFNPQELTEGDFEELIDELQPEVENQEGESVTPWFLMK